MSTGQNITNVNRIPKYLVCFLFFLIKTITLIHIDNHTFNLHLYLNYTTTLPLSQTTMATTILQSFSSQADQSKVRQVCKFQHQNSFYHYLQLLILSVALVKKRDRNSVVPKDLHNLLLVTHFSKILNWKLTEVKFYPPLLSFRRVICLAPSLCLSYIALVTFNNSHL